MELPGALKVRLIDSILKKPFPKNGVLRMGAGVELVDEKIIRFLRNGEPWLIAERRDGEDLICSTWNGVSHVGESRHAISDFKDNQFLIKHYYGPHTIFYESLGDYARGYYLRIPYAFIHLRSSLERAGTFLYNRRRIVLAQRLELLTFMIEQAAEDTGALRQATQTLLAFVGVRFDEAALVAVVANVAVKGELKAGVSGIIFVITCE